MSIPPLDDESLRETVEVYEASGRNAAEAARRLGKPDTTIKSRLHRAARLGLLGTAPVLPGFRISKVSTKLDAEGNVEGEFVQQKPDAEGQFTVPEGHAIKGVSAYLDGQGNVVGQWVKTKAGELDPLAVVEALKAAFDGYESPRRETWWLVVNECCLEGVGDSERV